MNDLFIKLNNFGKAATGIQFLEVFSTKAYKVERLTESGDAVIYNEDYIIQYIPRRFYDFVTP